jgi:hypothetical protein
LRRLLSSSLLLWATVAAADPIPSGSLGVFFGGVSGTGADEKHTGFGVYQFGAMAQWQPMTAEQRIGWALRWSLAFSRLYDGDAASIDDVLRQLQLDATLGLRIRPGASTSRFLTVRAGPALLRANERIAPSNQRAFIGGVATVGYEIYIKGVLLLDLDVHYGLIGGDAPSEVGVTAGIGIIGP